MEDVSTCAILHHKRSTLLKLPLWMLWHTVSAENGRLEEKTTTFIFKSKVVSHFYVLPFTITISNIVTPGCIVCVWAREIIPPANT